MKTFKPSREFVPGPPRIPGKRSKPAAPPRSREPAAPAARSAPAPETKPASEAAAVPAPAPAPPAPPAATPAPTGAGYLLSITKAALFDKANLGQGVKVIFTVAEGEHQGSVARGVFPFAKPGFAVLCSAALGETVATCDAALLERLRGAKVVADVERIGEGQGAGHVRNIRPATAPSNH